jgi:hypothetical protein
MDKNMNGRNINATYIRSTTQSPEIRPPTKRKDPDAEQKKKTGETVTRPLKKINYDTSTHFAINSSSRANSLPKRGN